MKISSFAVSTATRLILSVSTIAAGQLIYKVHAASSLYSSQSSLEREYHSCKFADQSNEFESNRCGDLIRLYRECIDPTNEKIEEKENLMMLRKY